MIAEKNVSVMTQMKPNRKFGEHTNTIGRRRGADDENIANSYLFLYSKLLACQARSLRQCTSKSAFHSMAEWVAPRSVCDAHSFACNSHQRL
jgi:hypothetical protein